MEEYINDHLKIYPDGRVLFYPVDFTSPGYLVPNERVRKRIIIMHQLYRFSCYLISAPIGIALLYSMAKFDSVHVSLIAGFAGYLLLYKPLEGWWRWYATHLASRLEKVHD